MSYVGPRPDSQIYAQPAIDYFSGNGSTTSFTLSRPVVSTAQMIVSVANVIQNPGSAFTVNGTTLQFTGTPPAGTNNIWVQYTTPITQINQPGQGTVGTTQMMDAAVTAAKIADTTITPSKLTVGAISWDSSGRVTMPYQPCFSVCIAGGTFAPNTDVVFPSAIVNNGNHYNTSNGRFTAPVAGNYKFSFNFLAPDNSTDFDFRFTLNGTTSVGGYTGNQAGYKPGGSNVIFPMAAGDWVTCRAVIGTKYLHTDPAHNVFSGHLIG